MKKFWGLCLVSILISLVSQACAQTNAWKVRRSHTMNNLWDITYANGLFVAVGNNETIVTSPDGANWTVRSHRPAPAGGFSAVAFGNGVFVAVGSGTKRIVTSRNGIIWQAVRRGTEGVGIAPAAVIYRHGLFVAVGGRFDTGGGTGILVSRDGYRWRPVSSAGGDAIAYGNGRFLTIRGSDPVYTSTNGLTWEIATEPPAYFTDVVFNGSEFVASGQTRFVGGNQNGGLESRSSPDGMTWTELPPASFYISDYARGRAGIAAVGVWGTGQGRVQISPDALSWPGESTVIPKELFGVTYGPNSIVAVGYDGFIVQSKLVSAPQ